MKRLILVAAGGLLVASANSPAPTTTAAPAAGAYPPCSAGVTDRCIQGERRVAVAHRAATPARPGAESELSSVVGANAPAPAAAPAAPARVARATYPRCSATVRDRCVQGRGRAAPAARREIQLAMRAGERG